MQSCDGRTFVREMWNASDWGGPDFPEASFMKLAELVGWSQGLHSIEYDSQPRLCTRKKSVYWSHLVSGRGGGPGSGTYGTGGDKGQLQNLQ